jgi:hypothetical protein
MLVLRTGSKRSSVLRKVVLAEPAKHKLFFSKNPSAKEKADSARPLIAEDKTVRRVMPQNT